MGWAIYLTFSVGRRWLGYHRLERRRKTLATPLDLTVLDRQDHGHFVRLWLGRADGHGPLPSFEAGDYLVLASPARQRRCYSLAGWHASPQRYELIIKHEEGGAVSGWAHRELQPGSRIRTMRPRGSFRMVPCPRGTHVLVGAGVGITPLRAMLHQYLDHKRGAPIVLFWTVRHISDLMDCHEEFLALSKQHRQFRYCPHVTGADATSWAGARSRIDAAALLQQTGGANQLAGVWICASITMVERLQLELTAMGVAASRIHHEAFGGAAPAVARDCHVEVEPEGRSLHFQTQPSLLHLLEEAEISMASECRTGQCGQCRLTLQSGEVEWVTQPERRPAGQQLLACCVRPVSDIRIRIDTLTQINSYADQSARIVDLK